VADDLKAAGCERVTLTGGEPLLRPDWEVIAQRLFGLGIEVSLQTNGVLIEQDTVSQMTGAGLSAVTVSVDGPKDVHDTTHRPASLFARSPYDRAIRGMGLVAQSGLQLTVATSIHQLNLERLAEFRLILIELGVEVWQLQLAMPFGRALELPYTYVIEPRQIPRLLDQLGEFVDDGGIKIGIADNIGYYSRHEPKLRGSLRGRDAVWSGCLAGCRIAAISANGDVKGCPSHPSSFVVGNVRQESFSRIFADSSRFSYNTQWKKELLEGACAGCPFGEICRAGCTSMAFALTGTIYHNPLCFIQAQAKGSDAQSA
jgi:radical SAM protein with 4Fe4S-binding SPASM domain